MEITEREKGGRRFGKWNPFAMIAFALVELVLGVFLVFPVWDAFSCRWLFTGFLAVAIIIASIKVIKKKRKKAHLCSRLFFCLSHFFLAISFVVAGFLMVSSDETMTFFYVLPYIGSFVYFVTIDRYFKVSEILDALY